MRILSWFSATKSEMTGVPSDRLRLRLERAKELYDNGYADYIVVIGGMGKEGYDESAVMMEYFSDKGVEPSSLIMDSDGYKCYTDYG